MTAQYNAWCLNNGDHQTAKRGHENWNAKIIWKMRMELENQWDLVEEEVGDQFEVFLDDATRIFRALQMGFDSKFFNDPERMSHSKD